jgi:hypothetical protein
MYGYFVGVKGEAVSRCVAGLVERALEDDGVSERYFSLAKAT